MLCNLARLVCRTGSWLVKAASYAVLVLRAAPQRRGYEDGQFHACPAWTAPPLVGTYCLS
jgi:hypothetical protein